MRISVRRSCSALVAAVALLVPAASVSAGETHTFYATGSWTILRVQGGHFEASRTGRASPGGPFEGVFGGKWVNGSGYGPAMLDFGQGDTITYEWYVELDEETGLMFGVEVVTGGTGKFAGASGTWYSIGVPNGDTGTFTYYGTISY